jgi:hypothetical protein
VSGTQLIQELVSEGMHAIKKHEPAGDKIMRMHTATSTMENGFGHLPDTAAWLGECLHELTCFPKGKFDVQTDSTSQALDWFKQLSLSPPFGLLDCYNQEEETLRAGKPSVFDSPLTNRGALLCGWRRNRFPFGRR